jgi:tetratricopeptide (TPR) repeat protein
MTILSRVLAALLVTGVAVPAAAQAQSAPAQVRPSKSATKAIVELQKAVKANDLAGVKARAAEATAVAATKEDRYLIGQLQLTAALAANDMALANTGVDAIAAAGFLDPAKVAQLYSGLGVKAYQAKQNDVAANLFNRAVTLDPRNVEALSFLGEAKIAAGQKAEGVAAFQRAIQASGAKPQEALLRRALAVAYENKLPVANEFGRQWIANYPSAESWRTALSVFRQTTRPDAESTVDVMRLIRANGGLTATDFALYANLLSQQSNFIEAQTALDQAAAAVASNAQLQGQIAEIKARPRVTAAELESAAKNAQSGMALLRIGDRFYGLGQYAKAAEVYRQAQAKGVEANLANERIGVALASAGDKAGAAAALNSVSGARAEVAKYWLLYVQTRS